MKAGTVYLTCDGNIIWYLGSVKEYNVPVLYFYCLGHDIICASNEPNTFVFADEYNTLKGLRDIMSVICSSPAKPANVARVKQQDLNILGEITSEYKGLVNKFRQLNSRLFV